jgi:valyl-tRNA synthetase
MRKEKNVAPKVAVALHVVARNEDRLFDSLIVRMCNVHELVYAKQKPANAYSFIVGGNEYFIPFNEEINVDEEIKNIKEEIAYTKGFLVSVEKKLGNEKFVQSAPPQVVDTERKKQADALAKLKLLEEKLAAFSHS